MIMMIIIFMIFSAGAGAHRGEGCQAARANEGYPRPATGIPSWRKQYGHVHRHVRPYR